MLVTTKMNMATLAETSSGVTAHLLGITVRFALKENFVRHYMRNVLSPRLRPSSKLE
jgi:hypothetical protein